MNELESLVRDYRVAFLRYLPKREEVALSQGYEIGRAAFARGISVLHLTQVHHTVLAEVLATALPEEMSQIAAAAAEFQMEVLAPFDMARRERPQRPDTATPTT
ncbi:phosphatase RsbU N-terminal domain-containing protein [Ornithinimicrobium cavernae]|uniref:phosphatase RsbU N-terminal domain-containing protein n=1 Tax=Ornithinimicrobium cavernae TaxID=2666047 RepID=UPI000D69820B|nr:phosphatase RsbU N-terminal domain-containing protein [Ornithinimicrobium cavernae]